MTVKYTDHEGTKEKQIVMDQNCTQFKSRFSKDEFIFGDEANTTFYIHVYDFEPPLWIIISFSQHPKLDLLQFFITFSTCFLALLLIAAVLWKIKQKFDRYRRRQRLYVEMEQMASRPFGSVLVELDKLPDHNATSNLPNSSTVNSALSESNAQTGSASAPVNMHHSGRSNRSSSNDRNVSQQGERISTLPSGVVVNREENVTNVRRRRKVRFLKKSGVLCDKLIWISILASPSESYSFRTLRWKPGSCTFTDREDANGRQTLHPEWVYGYCHSVVPGDSR